MSYRIADRLLIWTGTAASVFVLCGGQPGAADVAVILISLIMALLSELRRFGITGLICALIVTVSSFPVPGMALVMPTVVYSMYICPGDKGSKAAPVLRLTAVVLMALAAVCADISPVLKCMVMLFAVFAFYLAFKTAMHERIEEELRSKYDDARLDSLNARRLREETMKNADNEVYMATLKERNRIAREIHDNVGHMITRVIVQLQAIRIINKDENVGKQLDSVAETLDLAMTSMRRSVHELHDDSIDLSIGINEITDVLKDKFDVTVNTYIDSPADNSLKNAVLGIIREGVTNISKYSSGDKVIIEVVENVSFWRIMIHDNGKNEVREYDLTGADVVEGGGIGLSNIASRARSVGGRANAVSGPDGFTITATIPKKQ